MKKIGHSSSLSRVIVFFRRKGLRAIPGRLAQEMRVPTTPLGLRIHPLWRAGRKLRRAFRRGGGGLYFGTDTLVAFYDLQVSPITFDFAWFLVAADLERIRQRLEHLHIVIVFGETWRSGPESSDYLAVIDGAARRQRLFDILIPLTDLMPSVDGVTFTGDRALANRIWDVAGGRAFPADYSPSLPYLAVPFPKMVIEAAKRGEEIPSLRAAESVLRRAVQWTSKISAGRPFVTITLRDFDYQQKRNSNLHDWVLFADELRREGFAVAFIPDTHRTLDPEAMAPLADFPVLVEAAWNIAFRAAVYESASINLGINTGPMALNWLNRRCRYIAFKMVLDDEPGSSLEFQRSLGLNPLEPFPFATSYQVLCVEKDELAVLRREFQAMWNRLKVDEGPELSCDGA